MRTRAPDRQALPSRVLRRTSAHCSRSLLETIPPPSYEPDHPLQALVTNLDASPYVGRLALLRVHHGTLRKGATIAWCRADGTIETARVTELYTTEALDRVPALEAGPGEIVALAGLPDVTIGETIADPDDARPLPVTTVDEPSLSVTIGINTSVLAGTEGDRLTASQIKNRLDQELVGNVSLRVLPTSRPDAWEVQGRGELQLAVLVELMRREGFELTVGKPEVLTKTIDGARLEPVERVAIDVPEEYIGVVTQLLALRKGRLQQMVNHGTGWARMEYVVPARGSSASAPSSSPRRAGRESSTTCSRAGSRGTANFGHGRRAVSSPTAAGRPPTMRSRRCRSAARCSSSPGTSSTRE